jgi:hypothetical protein
MRRGLDVSMPTKLSGEGANSPAAPGGGGWAGPVGWACGRGRRAGRPRAPRGPVAHPTASSLHMRGLLLVAALAGGFAEAKQTGKVTSCPA